MYFERKLKGCKYVNNCIFWQKNHFLVGFKKTSEVHVGMFRPNASLQDLCGTFKIMLLF